MKRKVVKHGYGTLTISLPAKWTQANNIKSGQYLNLNLAREGLLVSANEGYFDKIETILTSDKEWYIYRILRHIYTYGYDEVKVNYSKTEHLALIRKCLEALTGFEIIESNPKFCRIKCVISVDDMEYENIVKRVLWLILSQFDYFIEDAQLKKPKMYQEVSDIYRTVSKLNNLCRRLINKKPPYDAVTSKYAYRYLTSLLNVASFILYSYDYAKKTDDISLTKNEFALVKQVRDFYHSLLLAYQNMDIEKTRLFFEQREAMFDDVLEVMKEKNPVITHYFLDILKELSSVGNLIIILKIDQENKK